MLVVIDLINKQICYFDNLERPNLDNTILVAERVVWPHFPSAYILSTSMCTSLLHIF